MRWTDKELNVLRDNFYMISAIELIQLLPDRSWSSISSKAYYLQEKGWPFKGKLRK